MMILVQLVLIGLVSASQSEKEWNEMKEKLIESRRLNENTVSCLPTQLQVIGCTPDSIIEAAAALGCDISGDEDIRTGLKESCDAIKHDLDDKETYNLATAPSARLRPLISDEEELFIHFNGGGEVNQKRDTDKGNTKLVHVGRKIKQVYNSFAQDERIAYPRIYQFNQDDSQGSLDPDLVYPNCAHNIIMCCFTSDRQANDNNGNCALPYDEHCIDADPADNTDICYSDHSRSPRSPRTADGFSIFEDEDEGDAHCHGIVWGDDKYADDARFAGNSLFYVSFYDHLYTRGYVQAVPGAPMCGCLERMPTVSRSDCTQLDVEEKFTLLFNANGDIVSGRRRSLDIQFNSCNGGAADNDLESEITTYYNGTFPEHLRKYITGPINNNQADSNCQDAIDAALAA